MADNERKETRDDGDKPDAPHGDNLLIPSAGASLPPATAHRDSHTPLTKAE